MKKLLKNYSCLVMGMGTLVSLICLLTFFIKSQSYFTMIFVIQVIVNFLVTGTILLANDIQKNSIKFRNISLYLFVTFFLLMMETIIATLIWDLNNYSNLMYLTNMKLYLSIYAIFVIFMILLSLYVIIREKESKSNIRQKSAKQ